MIAFSCVVSGKLCGNERSVGLLLLRWVLGQRHGDHYCSQLLHQLLHRCVCGNRADAAMFVLISILGLIAIFALIALALHLLFKKFYCPGVCLLFSCDVSDKLGGKQRAVWLLVYGWVLGNNCSLVLVALLHRLVRRSWFVFLSIFSAFVFVWPSRDHLFPDCWMYLC